MSYKSVLELAPDDRMSVTAVRTITDVHRTVTGVTVTYDDGSTRAWDTPAGNVPTVEVLD